VPADAAKGLDVQIRALSWGKHDGEVVVLGPMS